MTAKTADGMRVDKLCGDYVICQPQEGQRYTTDDMLVAWLAVREVKARSVVPVSFLDLGSGLCSVPMIILWSFPHSSGFGVEISPERCRLGVLSLAKNGLTERFQLMPGDLRGLSLAERFSLVTSSPPYYQESEGPVSPNADKAGVRFELNGSIEDYCRTAAGHLEQGGIFATVYPFQYRLRALQGCARLRPEPRTRGAGHSEGGQAAAAVAVCSEPERAGCCCTGRACHSRCWITCLPTSSAGCGRRWGSLISSSEGCNTCLRIEIQSAYLESRNVGFLQASKGTTYCDCLPSNFF